MKPNTVHWHAEIIYADLGVHSQAELVAMVGRRRPASGWVMAR
jgi:DNA-binding CsgD family transcriptional regulator